MYHILLQPHGILTAHKQLCNEKDTWPEVEEPCVVHPELCRYVPRNWYLRSHLIIKHSPTHCNVH